MEAIILGLIIPFMGTVIGSSFVFFMKREMPPRMQKALPGFASGVMVAASVWSLLIPAIEAGAGMGGTDIAGEAGGMRSVLPATIGLLAGFAFLLLIDYATPHIHPQGEREGPKSRLSRTAMLALAVTIHNFPEGMAVGVGIAGTMDADTHITISGMLALSIGIAIQNIPEGAIISMPLRAAGNSKTKSFLIGSLSGIVEPLGGVIVLLLASLAIPVMPYLLAFAAGAMLYVVIEELIPEASQGKHSNIGTIGFALGFAMMMVLDVVLG